MLTDDRPLYDLLSCVTAVVAVAWLVFYFVRVAGRRRPGLHLGAALATATLARLATAGLFAAVPALQSVRGPDEMSFLRASREFANDPSMLLGSPRSLVGNLQVAYMGVQQWLLAPVSDLPLRVGHIALAVAAIAVVAVAVTDVAGVRAGTITAWILAVEPTNVFFSGILHKESPMLLGEALVLLGGVRMYQRRDARAVAIMVLGLAIAGFTRPYAAAALAAACAAVTAHSALRRIGPRRQRSMPVLAGLALALGLAVAAAPAPAAVLGAVQLSQNANATDGSNLALAPVDVSSVQSAASNLGSRVSALLLRPLPWEATNTSQRLSVVGTAVAWMLLLAALVLALTRPKAIADVAPLLYVLVMLTIVYALSTGNAGTGFRYRTHIIVALAGLVAALACCPSGASYRRVART